MIIINRCLGWSIFFYIIFWNFKQEICLKLNSFEIWKTWKTISIIFLFKKLISLTIFCLKFMWSRIIFNNFKKMKIKLSSRRKKKKFEKFKNAAFFEKNQRQIKTFENPKTQYINHDVVKWIKNQRSEICRNRQKSFRLKKRFWFFLKRNLFDKSRFFLL